MDLSRQARPYRLEPGMTELLDTFKKSLRDLNKELRKVPSSTVASSVVVKSDAITSDSSSSRLKVELPGYGGEAIFSGGNFSVCSSPSRTMRPTCRIGE